MKVNSINSTYTPYFSAKKPEDRKPKTKSFQEVKENASDRFHQVKTNLWLSTNIPTKRNIKAFLSDSVAYTYELFREPSGKVISKETLGEISLKNRKTNKDEKLKVKKVVFEDQTAIYSINKGIERLAFADVDIFETDVLHIDYATTIVGREDFHNLFITLMQSIVEDAINNNGEIPAIEATPAPIGNKKFDRALLYGFYGAETKLIDTDLGHEPLSIISSEKIKRYLDAIEKSPKRQFLFEKTALNFKNIRNNQDNK